MSRLVTAIGHDITLQVRNRLYHIGIGVGVAMAAILAWLAGPDQLWFATPVTLVLVVGGSTLLYVAGMMTFERDEGTLDANIVTPLRAGEYLTSKVVSLTLLATVESTVIVGGATASMAFGASPQIPNLPLAVVGTAILGAIYTLIGIVLVVRYDTITDFLVPVVAVASILQLPFIHFLGVVEYWGFLVIPTSAPTMIVQGAYVGLSRQEWVYAVGYSVFLVGGLAIWASRSFDYHIVKQGR